jgi:GDP-L-fucose synthase
MEKDSKIYVAGHLGLAGSAILQKLQERGFSNLVYRTHQELDLTQQGSVEEFFLKESPDYVFLAAAKVGGIGANDSHPAEFIYDNLAIQTHVIQAAWRTRVKGLVFLGSSCIYPRDCPQPIREEYLLTGPLEPTNQSYAVAKIAGIVQCEAYNRQYGCRFLAVMPTNLYGNNDNYNLENSHVLAALIRKFHLARLAVKGGWDSIKMDEIRFGSIPDDFLSCLVSIAISNGHKPPPFIEHRINVPDIPPAVGLWGTGRPRREFLDAGDLADACVFLMDLPSKRFQKLLFPSPALNNPEIDHKRYRIHPMPIINIGYGKDQTIHEMARQIAKIVGYKGDIVWDQTKPDGTPQKLLDASRMEALGWRPKISLEKGIKSAYQWYCDQV